MTTGYCMKCKDKKEMVNTTNVTTKNGRHAVKGKCKKCGTNMYVILAGKSGSGTKKSKRSKKSKKSRKSGGKSKRSKRSKKSKRSRK